MSFKKGICIIVKALLSLSVVFLFCLSPAQAKELSYVDQLMEQYAEILLPGLGDEYSEKPLLELLKKAENYRDKNKEDVNAWKLCARIRFAYANTQGVITGLKIVKEVRKEMEKVGSLNIQHGLALEQGFLGYLYLGMPPWPISFGNKRKGRKMLEEAYFFNPESSVNNYFYSYIFIEKKDYQQAQYYLNKSLALAKTDKNDLGEKAYALRIKTFEDVLLGVEHKLTLD